MKPISAKAVKKKIGLRISSIRKSQKISQEQLGFEAGLSREEISYLENGHKNVTIETLCAIAQALDVPVKDLLEFDY